MRLRLPLAVLVPSLFVPAFFAQSRPAPGAVPAGRAVLQPQEDIATLSFAPFDREALRKEDAEREAQGLPPRFAVQNERHLTPRDAGTWEDFDADTLLWRLRIRSPGALSLNLGFGEFRLTPNARLSLHSADQTHVVRPFTSADNAPHGELWSPVVLCDDLVIELVVPRAEVDDVMLELTWINQGYRGFGASSTALMSGSCNLDVVCPEGIPWALEIPSVGVISTGGSTFCTGFLVNNVRQDLKPYFMTANHCGINSGNAASLVVYWNYENSTCRPAGSPSSGGPGDGSLAQFHTGAFFRASSSPSDFTLVELDSAVNPSFEVSWAGWDATGANGTSAVGIHHPNTDEKRISFENQATVTSSYLGTTSPGDGTHVRIVDWDVGTTEPGSSGSPVFNQAHRVLGQLHGGGAACGNNDSDYFGRFSVSWTGGGTNTTRLRTWLDPDNTGALVIDSVSLATLCSDAGTIVLDHARYSCSSTLTVDVTDCGLNLSSASADSVIVSVASTSESGGENVLLTETGPNTSHFRGTLALSGANSPGVLLVSAGDALTALYVDADDGNGGTNVPVTDGALVDCTPPTVFSVSFSNVTATSARMTVTADEPIVAEALFGTSCGSNSQSEGGETLATSVDVELTGLQPDTVYFVEVNAVDESGNATLDTNGGACHSFATDDVPLFFTEEFLGDGDLDNTSFLFLPATHSDAYDVCKRPVTGFYTDPAGGTNISLSDDGSFQVVLTGGKKVKLYGTQYSSFFVNSNGNVTFGSSDSTWSETLALHFAKPRVAALFDDLNPTQGGTVSRKQLADRVAITWLNVPEHQLGNQNSLQIELFFDGRIRITQRAVASSDGIVGLSRGTGLSPQFVEQNLSGLTACPKYGLGE